LDFLSNGLSAGSISTKVPETLTYDEIRLMRVRDIRRRLTRNHGYSADDVARMLDKKDLIEALVLEEEKSRLDVQLAIKREQLKQGIITAVIAGFVVLLWPLLVHAYGVVQVNIVVWSDRKKYEICRCRELGSVLGLLGVLLMLIIDLLQVWMTATIALSWIIRRNKYFFPMPSLTVNPGQFMGQEVARSKMGNYGINVAPMAIGWLMRFVSSKVEAFTGRALAKARKHQRKVARAAETAEEKIARKAMRNQAGKEATGISHKESSFRDTQQSWMQPNSAWNDSAPQPADSAAHREFLDQIYKHSSEIDDDDQPSAHMSAFDDID
jgi:hypothetical protein